MWWSGEGKWKGGVAMERRRLRWSGDGLVHVACECCMIEHVMKGVGHDVSVVCESVGGLGYLLSVNPGSLRWSQRPVDMALFIGSGVELA